MKFNIKKVAQLILFLGVGFILLYLVYHKYNAAFLEQCAIDGTPEEDCNLIEKVWTDMTGINVPWILMVFACFIMANISRAIRWAMLIEPLGKNVSVFNLFLANAVGYFANLGFPRIGELVRAGVVAKYEDIPVSKVVGTVAIDRIADLFAFGLCVMLSVFLEYKRIIGFIDHQGFILGEGQVWLKLLLFAAAGIVGLFVLRWLLRRFDHISIVARIKTFLKNILDGVKTIMHLKRPFWFIFHSFVIWIMFYLMTYVGFSAFTPTEHLGMRAGLTAFVFGALGFVVPSPGGMGTYHFFMTEALKIYGLEEADGFSFSNIMFFSVQIGCNVLLGIFSLILLPVYNSKKELVSDAR